MSVRSLLGLLCAGLLCLGSTCVVIEQEPEPGTYGEESAEQQSTEAGIEEVEEQVEE